MKKLFFWFFISVIGCLPMQVRAQSESPLSQKRRSKTDERIWQIIQEFDRQIQEKEPGIDLDDRVFFSKLDYWFKNVYPHRDTVGSQRLFERALSPRLQQAVRDMAEKMEGSGSIMEIHIYEKDGNRYCCLTPVMTAASMGDKNGYLLYRNKVLVEIRYDSKALAELVMKPDELKEIPYDRFLQVGEESWIGTYDDPSDFYRIGRKGRLKFLGSWVNWVIRFD